MFVEFIGIDEDDNRVINHLTVGNIYEVKSIYKPPGRNLCIYTIINDSNISCTYNSIFFIDAIHKIRDQKINNILYDYKLEKS